MTNTLLEFSTPLKPKMLFKVQNQAKVDALVQSFSVNAGGDTKKALNQLWKALSDDAKKEWEEKAAQSIDVARYISRLLGLIENT